MANECVTLDRILLGTPFLRNHNIKLFFDKNSCKIMGNFITENGYQKVKLHTTFGKTSYLQAVNLTQITKCYNLVDFQLNNMVCSDIRVTITQPTNLGLQFPDIIKITPSQNLQYKSTGWPFLQRSDKITIPLYADNVLQEHKAILKMGISKVKDNDLQVNSVQYNTEQLNPILQNKNENNYTYCKKEYINYLQKSK